MSGVERERSEVCVPPRVLRRAAGRSGAGNETNRQPKEGAFHPWEEEDVFTIESKRFSFSRTKLGRIQICEESRKNKFRFWVDLETLHWFRRCFESIVLNPLQVHTKERRIPGNKRFTFSLCCNSVGFFVRFCEVREEGKTTIVVPEGVAGFGFRLFCVRLKVFCSSMLSRCGQGNKEELCPRFPGEFARIEEVGPLQRDRFLLPNCERLTADPPSPSAILFHDELRRGGCELQTEEGRRRKEFLTRMAETKGWLLLLLLENEKRDQQHLNHSPLNQASTQGEAQTVHSRTKSAVNAAQTMGGSHPSGLIVKPLGKTTSKLDTLLSAHLGSLPVPKHASQSQPTSEGNATLTTSAGPNQHHTPATQTESMLGSQNIEGQTLIFSGGDVGATTLLKGNTHIETPGNGKVYGHMDSDSACSGNKTRGKQVDGRNEGFSAFKRMATSGLKNVINAGRSAAVSYLKSKDHERSDQGKSAERFNDVPLAIGSHHTEPKPMRVFTSQLNVNATPFEPLSFTLVEGNIKAAQDLDLDEANLMILADKGKKVCAAEIEVCDEEDRSIHDRVLEEPNDFKLGKGGKANKGKKSKSKKKRR